MPNLSSELLSVDQRLNDCAVRDSAHVLKGDRGDFVRRIQAAVFLLDGTVIDAGERSDGFYGQSTADAVLEYKRARKIINPAYQSKPDAIVGKMTIATLDSEMVKWEARRSGNLRIDHLRPSRRLP